MPPALRSSLLLGLLALSARGEVVADSPEAMAAAVRALVSSGAGALMPDLDRAYVEDGGLVPLGEGDFPAMFLHGLVAEWRDGVAVFPVEVRLDDATGDAYFLDALGEPFWYIPSEVPERYRPWLVANPWFAPSRAGIRWTFVHDADAALLRAASAPAARRAAPLRSLPTPPVTNLCFTGFSYTGTSVWFSAAWPASALPLPGDTLDVYAKTNLLDAHWFPLAELPVAPAATNATLEIVGEDIPGFFVPPHVHDATCPAVTNITFDLVSNEPVTGIVYRCYRYQAVSSGFLRLGTRLDTDGDGLSDAYEILSFGTDPDNPDSDGDGIPDGISAEEWMSHELRGEIANHTNFVLRAVVSSSRSGSAAFRLGTLTLPLLEGTNELQLCLKRGRKYSFGLFATGGSQAGATLETSNPSTDLAGLRIDDPDGALSGSPSCGARTGELALPRISLVETEGRGTCVHEFPGWHDYRATAEPGSWNDWRSLATIEGFWGANGGFLFVADEPRSVTSGVIRIASTDSRLPPYEAGVTIHRCEYDPDTGACELCGETHDVAGLTMYFFQDATRLLVGTTNRIEIRAGVPSGIPNSILWEINPTDPDGARLYTGPGSSARLLNDNETASAVWVSAGDLTNAYSVTACFPFASEPSEPRTVTTVAIDAEAICSERTAGGQIVNPVAFPVGETATFRAKVFPEDIPDLMVRWRIVSGSDFAKIEGPSFGREVVLRGLDEGTVELELWIPGYIGPLPKFTTRVHPLRPVPVAAWIVCDFFDGPVTNANHVEALVDAANAILRQVCISCYVDSVSFTNNDDWIDLGRYGTDGFYDKLQEMTAVSNSCEGIEVHFVQRMRDAVGVNTSNGMALIATAGPEVFAHEVGHAMGLDDIYTSANGWYPIIEGRIARNRSSEDWCGTEARGFYPEMDGLRQRDLIQRLVMFGDSAPETLDFSAGAIDGIRRRTDFPSGYEQAHVHVGVFENNTLLPAPRHE